ncbi:uncharacterized protein [Rutidosis leptorrhynchoides]|uniref:uncharacterized protein n=1 Tax=Rutidosis leptorrhynchoides TaxID=125765 RepID=UPI003A98E0E5
MSEATKKTDSITRLLGGTEQNWCKVTSSGTGIAVMALQASKHLNITHLKEVLHKIQNNHPILTSMLLKNISTGSNSFIINPPIPHLHLNVINQSKTSELLTTLVTRGPNPPLSPLHMIFEHELNINEWTSVGSRSLSMGGFYLMYATLYTLADEKWILAMRLHTAICDRLTGVSLLRELREVIGKNGAEGHKEGYHMAIEDLIPIGKAKKTMWEHGKDMVTYSFNTFRLSKLKFKNVKGPFNSEVVRFKMSSRDTQLLLAGCKSRGIKFCGVMVAAILLAVYSSKRRSSRNNRKKYGVVFLNDCRSDLDPPLSPYNLGFYQSAINTIQEVKSGENLWDVATRSYTSFASSKNNNKHFTDIADLNYLMSKAVDNPSLTPKSSLRSALVTVFEDTIIENVSELQQDLLLDDFIGCASIHGIGPSIAVFDTIVDGKLDCLFVYPSPLHSREQIEGLIAHIQSSLVEATKMEEI